MTNTEGPNISIKKYQWLEVLRGLAAVWVLLHHADLTTTAFHSDLGSIFISRGLIGVDFFFILSGFIISYSGIRMIEEGRGLKEYATARLLRIYAPYLPIGVGLFIAYQLFPHISAGDRSVGLLTSATLFPTQKAAALSVAWTLQHELIFYMLFGCMFISQKLGVTVLLSWFAFITASYLTGTQYTLPFVDVLANPLNLWFMVGMLISKAPLISMKPKTWSLTLLGLSLALYSFVVLDCSRFYVGLILALVIYVMTKSDKIQMEPPRILLLLGAASYSIYLIHNPIQSIVARVLARLGYDFTTTSYFTLVAIASLLIGLAYYFIVELRAVRWSKSFMRNRYP